MLKQKDLLISSAIVHLPFNKANLQGCVCSKYIHENAYTKGLPISQCHCTVAHMLANSYPHE